MPAISVLLPSVRKDSADRVISRFLATQVDFDYEIVLVSPFSVDQPHVHHVVETERGGVVKAMNVALAAAKADHIVLWSDDAMPTQDCLRNIHRFVQGKPAPFVAGFNKREQSGRVNEQWSVYSKLYVGWLCTSRETIAKVGELLDPVYRNYWSDPDFCLRVWDAGGTVSICPDAWVEIVQINDDVKFSNIGASFERDMRVFFDRWHEKHGQGRSKVWWRINTQIPNSPMGHIRAVLRQMPYLKELVDALRLRNKGTSP